jgi:hypothetical protein
VVGASRKSFIGAATGVERPADRLEGTIVCNAAALWGGAHVLRDEGQVGACTHAHLQHPVAGLELKAAHHLSPLAGDREARAGDPTVAPTSSTPPLESV